MEISKGAPELLDQMRNHMIETQLKDRGIINPRVLAAFRQVPRDRFVRHEDIGRAFDDRPLPIGFGQTISQPYVVALMLQALDLQPTDRVLEIGTGSLYNAALMAQLAHEVYTIEIVPELAKRALLLAEELNLTNIHLQQGDGYLGWQEQAPFDVIVLTAAPKEFPPALAEQLKNGGRLLAPIGDGQDQKLLIFTKDGRQVDPMKWAVRDLGAVQFVPMVSAYKSNLN